MALNWNSYMTDGSLNQSDKEWPDISTPTTARPLVATASAANDQSSQGQLIDSEHTSPYDGMGTGDDYFTDTFYQPDGNFLQDLDILQPFGNAFAEQSTSESSPEPLSATDLFNQSLFAPLPQQVTSRSSKSLKRSTEPTEVPSRKMSASSTSSQQSRISPGARNNPTLSRKNGFSENLIFSNTPSGSSRTYASGLDANRESMTVSKEPESSSKRVRQRQADTLSACWTSPLCPNHTDDGSPPDPTTCGAACAPFLFASPDESNSPTILDQSLLRNHIDLTIDSPRSPDVPLDTIRGIKRSESESSTVPSGRVFPKPSSKAQTASAGVKRESTASRRARDDHDESTSPDAHTDLPDIHAASRRRQPHNQVERKYRESLNTQLESLRRVVPSLQPSPEEAAQASQGGSGCADIEDLPAARKPSKAVVLASATAYIRQMEKEKRQLADENQVLKTRIKALQALVKCEDCSLMQYVMNLNIQAAS